MSFSPSGGIVAAGSARGQLCAWKTEEEQSCYIFDVVPGRVQDVVVSDAYYFESEVDLFSKLSLEH